MGKVAVAGLVLLFLVMVAAGVAIMTLDLPAPTERVEKVVPNERLFD